MADDLVRAINHVSVLVEDFGDAERLLTQLLGFRLERRIEDNDGGASLAFFRSGSAMVELVRLHDEVRRRDQLAGARAVIDHIAFDVDDAQSAAIALTAAGVRLREPFRAPDDDDTGAGVRSSHRAQQTRIFFTDPSSTAGVVFQFVQEADVPVEGRGAAGPAGTS
jgi:catechol 2,3-dioxygenase-like lactoylglutathione lyase family enzyme